MFYLSLVSAIWAASFTLIKKYLGDFDPALVSGLRLGLSFLVFLPIYRFGKLAWPQVVQLLGLGLIQYGLMYVLYIYSYRFLLAHEVALLTITTPILVVVVDHLLRRRIHVSALAVALLAVVGSGVIMYSPIRRSDLIIGVVILQLANLCFAWGQIYYREWHQKNPGHKGHEIFALLYLGATLFCLTISAGNQSLGDIRRIGSAELYTLIYLGVIASGLGFFLWNHAATQVSTAVLAVFNNLKIPLAVIISLMFFGHRIDLWQLVIGTALIGCALYLSAKLGSQKAES